MRKTRRVLSGLLLLALPACGDDSGDTEDTAATTAPATTTMADPTSGATDDSPTGGNATVMSGNNLACRLYHLTAAANSDADAAIHCPHIAAGSPVCI